VSDNLTINRFLEGSRRYMYVHRLCRLVVVHVYMYVCPDSTTIVFRCIYKNLLNSNDVHVRTYNLLKFEPVPSHFKTFVDFEVELCAENL